LQPSRRLRIQVEAGASLAPVSSTSLTPLHPLPSTPLSTSVWRRGLNRRRSPNANR
uniref:Uncharacterized protein n=1 Tax=Mesocestoides corti TaxID=53468 RepID=A0A0R3UPE0_MESCO